MNIDDDVVGICQRRANRSRPGRRSPWDGRHDGEKLDDMIDRHKVARLACVHCPLIDACEAYLSAHEVQGLHIEGVVAGRYTDVLPGWSGNERKLVQSHCRGCRRRLQQQKKRDEPLRGEQRPHVGEGMCNVCHPRFSRAARQGRTAA